MDKRHVIGSVLIVLAWAGQAAYGEFPPLPEQDEQAVNTKPSTKPNRWVGNFPEPGSTQTPNPWGGSGPIVPGQVPNQSVIPKEQFPAPDYSPYREGRKRIRERNRGMGPADNAMPPAVGAYPGYGSYYYPPPAGYPPYGGYGGYGDYPGGGWPGNFGGPWRGGGWPGNHGGAPWNGRGGNFPFSPFNW